MLIGLISLVVVVLVLGIVGFYVMNGKLQAIPRVDVSSLTPVQSGQPVDFLLIGSDSRGCETTAQQAKAFGSKQTQTGQRADTIIVMRLLSGNRIEMFSIPRDTWLPIAGTNASNKINSAFNNGPSQLVSTIQDNFHIPINHVMEVNFCGFPAMVDALGGVYMDFRYPVVDTYTGLHVTTTGCQLVPGYEALQLVRSRHLQYETHGHWIYDAMSDWSRIERQQQFFHALIDRVHQVVPDVFRLSSFASATASGLKVDSSLSSTDIMAIGWDYHSLGQSDLYTSVLPTTESVIDGEDVLLPATGPDHDVIQAFLAGTTSTFTSALGGRSITLMSAVVTGAGPEPWNPTPC